MLIKLYFTNTKKVRFLSLLAPSNLTNLKVEKLATLLDEKVRKLDEERAEKKIYNLSRYNNL
jgi:hypothetical protein